MTELPSTPREAARVYAHTLGWKILPIWPPEDGFCTCPNPRCESPGKHPWRGVGVYSATDDLDEIEAWPSQINIAVGLGEQSGGLMALDIDQPEVAAKVLAQIEDHAVSRTARGAHIFFISEGETNGFNLADPDTGEHLGEVRGDGQYVVLPPSQHVSGVTYEWQSLARMATTDDVQEHVRALLDELADQKIGIAEQVELVDMPDAAIEPLPLPRELVEAGTTNRDLRAWATSNIMYEPEDRSEFLYNVAMYTAEAYDRLDLAVSAETVAAHTRFIHDRLKLNKYTGPKEFYRIGLKAVTKHHTDVADAPSLDVSDDDKPDDVDPSTATIFTPPGDGEYRFNEDEQELYYYRLIGNARSATALKVANFRPELMVEYEIDDAEEITRSWLVHLEQEGHDPYEVTWHQTDRDSSSQMMKTLSGLPARFQVRPDMAKHVPLATYKMADGGYEVQHEFATTGWVVHERGLRYLLPSMDGAMGPDGLDPSLRINPEHIPESAAPVVSGELRPYGLGVRTPQNAAEHERAIKAFIALIEACDDAVGRAKTTATALQILAGPLIPAGAGETPPLLHIRGSTGSMKTSLTTTALSMFGTWVRDLTPPPATWHSTPTFLQALVHGTKDLTLLIDDYKYGMTREDQVKRMIQQYSDRTARGRANTRGGITTTRLPRGLIISNGEDVWDHSASAEARTVEFIFGKNELSREKLGVAQQAVKDGDLQLFGGAWLQWIARNWEALVVPVLVRQRRDEWRDSLGEARPDAHMRVVTQVAVLGAVGTVVVDFVRETFPEYAEQVEEYVRRSALMLVGGIEERAELIRESAPFRQLAVALNEALTRGVAKFQVRGHDPASRAEQDIPAGLDANLTVIGYHWVENRERVVLLTENTSLDFFRKMSRMTSVPESFNWKSIGLDAMQNHGAVRADRIRVRVKGTGRMSQLSGWIVPLDTITGMEPEPIDEDDLFTLEPHED